MRYVWLVSVLLFSAPLFANDSSPTTSAAPEQHPHFWNPRTRSVAVFKNGFGFFLREGSVTTRDGWAVAREIPPATFGTLAIYSLKQDEVVDIVGSGPGEIIEFDGVDAADQTEVKRGRLAASVGLQVQLTYAHQEKQRAATGKLVSAEGEFAVLDSGENNFAVPVSQVRRMQILDLPLRVHVAAEGQPAEPVTRIGMAYLRQGITWIPEYTLQVLDDENAQLTLRGTLVNLAEDLIHCDVNFVVGAPHFAHTQYMAPLAVGQAIRTLGAAFAPREVQSQIANRAAISMSNVMAANQFDPSAAIAQPPGPASAELSTALGNLPQLDGPGAGDYTVYTKTDLTVRKGEKAIVTLFVKKIKYSHHYRWNLPGEMQHSLVLANDTDTAWTTGPCLAISGDRPLSEDLLRYTPKGARCDVPVAAAINIARDQQERETDRQFKAHSPAPNTFLDLVTIEGEIQLRNFEQRTAVTTIAISVPGKPVEASEQGKLTADSTRLQLLERAGSVSWNLSLQPGETRTLTYKYERYVPSG